MERTMRRFVWERYSSISLVCWPVRRVVRPQKCLHAQLFMRATTADVSGFSKVVAQLTAIGISLHVSLSRGW